MLFPVKCVVPDPVTLAPEQVTELNQKLSVMRHDVNGALAVIVATVELLRLKPQEATRFLASLGEQPSRIEASMKAFSLEFERACGVRRPIAPAGQALSHGIPVRSETRENARPLS